MPEVVKNWAFNSSISRVKEIQQAISVGYIADMAEYASKVDSSRIFACWDSIPNQLCKENQSTKFVWKTIGNGAKGATHRSAIDWLSFAGLVDVVSQVKCLESPLKTFENKNSFKLYLSDTGMLSNMCDTNLHNLNTKGPKVARFRGSLVENYIAQQLSSADTKHYYWGIQSKSEIEFVIATNDGVVPIEVKSGSNVASRSLKNIAQKYDFPYVIKLNAKNFGFENGIFTVPLYAAGLVATLQ